MKKTSIGETASYWLSMVISPIAWPGWGIEYLIGLKRPGWQFDTFTAVPYFLFVFGFCSAGIAYLPMPYAWLAFYPLFAALVLAFWISLSIALGNRGDVYRFLREKAKRTYAVPTQPVLANPKSIFGAACAYVFSAYFFGNLYLLIYRSMENSFSGIADGGELWIAWQFQYFSVVTIATIGYGDIAPKNWVAQASVVLEAAVGIYYVVFLFATLVSYHVTRITKS